MKKSSGSRFLIPVLFLLSSLVSGCGREIPEGYAEVKVRLGAAEKIDLTGFVGRAPGMLATSGVMCPVNQLFLSIAGPGIARPILKPLTGSVDVSQLTNGPKGTLVGGTEAGVLVPKGPARQFAVFGVIYADPAGVCDVSLNTGGFKSYPILGISPPIDVTQAMEVPVGADLYSPGFQAGITPLTDANLPIANSDFSRANVTLANWSSFCGSTCTVRIGVELKPAPDPIGFLMSVPNSPLTVSAASQLGFGPIYPFGRYSIIVYSSTLNKTTNLFVVRAPDGTWQLANPI